MATLASPRLQGGGHMVVSGADKSVSAPATHRGAVPRSIKDLSIEEMESALERFSRRLPDRASANCAPQTARVLLEENKQLIQEKLERKALERKNSKEFTETLLAKDRLTTENDKARDIGRRHAQRELAQYYKAKIAEKEVSKADEYRQKRQNGSEIQYFPFVEGENINKSREAQKGKMRDEMRTFLKKQYEDNPPRSDALLQDVNVDYAFVYPIMANNRGRHASARPSKDPTAESQALPPSEPYFESDEVAPHIQRYPRFLSRAREHMSRRLHDAHVRKALEDKVQQTKLELEDLARRRGDEAQQAEDGMLVNDALRYDTSQTKAMDRRRNAEYLKEQMEERRKKAESEVKERRREPAGYWGPEEKGEQGQEVLKKHCNDLIVQMEVNQHRRLDSRSRRIRQERRLVDNTIAEMTQDRERDKQKQAQHKEVLVTTWQSQQKIKKAMTRIGDL